MILFSCQQCKIRLFFINPIIVLTSQSSEFPIAIILMVIILVFVSNRLSSLPIIWEYNKAMASKIKDFLQANIFTPSFNKRIDDGATMFGELLLIVFGSIVIFFGLFVFFIILCVVIAPDDYVFRSVPELQISRTQENTYLAFYENGDKKPKFCQGIYDSSITFTTEMTAQSFCHFTYQPLPKLRGNVDISITEIQHVENLSICLLRQTQTGIYRQVCQKYPPIDGSLVAKDIRFEQIFSFSLEVQSSQAKIPSFKTVFKMQTGWLARFANDYYKYLAVMISFFLAVLLTIAVGVLRIKWLAMSAKFAKEGAKQQ